MNYRKACGYAAFLMLGVACGNDGNKMAAPDSEAGVAPSEETSDVATDSVATDSDTSVDSDSDDMSPDETITDDSATTGGTVTDNSTTDNSTTDDSTTDDEVTIDNSTTDDSTTDNSTTDNSTTDNSTTDNSTTDDSTTDDSTADDSTADDSTTDDEVTSNDLVDGGAPDPEDASTPDPVDGAIADSDADADPDADPDPDLCAEVDCSVPPEDVCASAATVTTYTAPGQCSAGSCFFDSIEYACTHGCSAGACACTDDDAVLVENGNQFPSGTSIDVDTSGGLHVAYWMDSGLHYAYRAQAGSWVHAEIDTEAPSQVGWYPSLFIDEDDGVHIAYGIVTTGGIRYAYRSATDATFDFDIVPVVGADHGLDISLAVDSGGGVHIAHRWTGTLFYTYRPLAGSWDTVTLDPPGTSNNTSPSLAIGPDDTVYIAFANPQDDICQLATQTASGAAAENFVYSEIDARETFPSLTVDADGGLHVALYEPPLAGNLHYGYRPPGSSSWTLTPIESDGTTGLYADVAADRFGGVHLTYYQQDDRDLRYAYKPAGGSFSARTIDGASDMEDAGESTSVVVDPAGVVHVSYSHRTDDALNTLRVCPTP